MTAAGRVALEAADAPLGVRGADDRRGPLVVVQGERGKGDPQLAVVVASEHDQPEALQLDGGADARGSLA